MDSDSEVAAYAHTRTYRWSFWLTIASLIVVWLFIVAWVAGFLWAVLFPVAAHGAKIAMNIMIALGIH